jgi:hypothetical protein
MNKKGVALTFYVTSGNKVVYWGKLSDCATYVSNSLPEEDMNIATKDTLNQEQKEWLHRIKVNLHSSADMK